MNPLHWLTIYAHRGWCATVHEHADGRIVLTWRGELKEAG